MDVIRVVVAGKSRDRGRFRAGRTASFFGAATTLAGVIRAPVLLALRR